MRITNPPQRRKASIWEITFSILVFTSAGLLFFNLGRAYEILSHKGSVTPSVAFQPQKNSHSIDSKPHAYPVKWADVIPPITYNNFKMPVKKVKTVFPQKVASVYLPPVSHKSF